MQSLTRPNGTKTSYDYDALNRLETLTNLTSTDSLLNRFGFTFNTEDLIDSETIDNADALTGFTEGLTRYDYNDVNQLLAVNGPEKTFQYDADGNLTRGYTPEGYVFTAVYDADDRLSAITYTDNALKVQKTEFIYDYSGFLAQLKTYEDDMLQTDMRIVRNGYLAVQERDAANTVTREYTWGLNMGGGIGGLLSMRQGGADYNYLYDGKGNVSAVVDSAEALVAKYRYDAFGNLMVKAGTLDQPYLFSTKRYLENLGLNYYGYRFYQPNTGRWLNRDPLGEAGGLNLYGAMGNDPVNWIDPYGLDTLPLQGIGNVSGPTPAAHSVFTPNSPENQLIQQDLLKIISLMDPRPLLNDISSFIQKHSPKPTPDYTGNKQKYKKYNAPPKLLDIPTTLPPDDRDPCDRLRDFIQSKNFKCKVPARVQALLIAAYVSSCGPFDASAP